MPQGYYYIGFGLHQGVEVIEDNGSTVKVRRHEDSVSYDMDSKAVTLLPQGHRFLSILWAGGWDEYIIDLSQVRDQTPEEMQVAAAAVARGGGVLPIIGDSWMRGLFTKGLVADHRAVKVISHIGGGD